MDEDAVVSYCGLCCLDCHGYTQKIPDQARDLRKELRRVHYEKFAENLSSLPFASGLRNYQECYDVLGIMMKFRCKKGCRNGGGNPFCQIRNCCQEKNFQGCWECNEYEKCKKLDFLDTNHGDAHRKNLVILQKKGVDGFLKGKRHWDTSSKK